VPLALAVDQTVTATPSNDFMEAAVTVDVGDTVTWTNAGGLHNVKFDDGSFEQPADPQSNNWTVSRTFDSAGTFRYYCELHGDRNGVGMSGSVTVNPANTAPSPSPPPGGDTSPAPPPPAAPGEPEPQAPDTTGAVISRFSLSRTRFRVGRGRGAGSAFRFQLSEPARVRIVIERLLPGRRLGGRCSEPSARNRGAPRCIRSVVVATLVRSNRTAGSNTIAFSGRVGRRALRPGRYRATLSATDAAGNRSRPKRRSFRIVAG
jgi:plastocyanin